MKTAISKSLTSSRKLFLEGLETRTVLDGGMMSALYSSAMHDNASADTSADMSITSDAGASGNVDGNVSADMDASVDAMANAGLDASLNSDAGSGDAGANADVSSDIANGNVSGDLSADGDLSFSPDLNLDGSMSGDASLLDSVAANGSVWSSLAGSDDLLNNVWLDSSGDVSADGSLGTDNTSVDASVDGDANATSNLTADDLSTALDNLFTNESFNNLVGRINQSFPQFDESLNSIRGHLDDALSGLGNAGGDNMVPFAWAGTIDNVIDRFNSGEFNDELDTIFDRIGDRFDHISGHLGNTTSNV